RSPTVKNIQKLLLRIGSATSGKKDVLLSRLQKDMRISKIPDSDNWTKRTRILSIDMGIKNLAFCVADVRLSSEESSATTMEIRAWRRLDVVEEVSKRSGIKKREFAKEGTGEDEERPDPYAPSSLSDTAYTLLKRSLLTYAPDIILIERQRWRSSGGSAIQQWTVRVNTLEGMLWAILTALRTECRITTRREDFKKYNYRIFGVDPKRVGGFWLGDRGKVEGVKRRSKKEGAEEVGLGPESETEDGVGLEGGGKAGGKLSRGKAEKKAKIWLLRSWLDREPPSTALSKHTKPSPDEEEVPAAQAYISFSFFHHAEATRQTLLYATDAASERSKRTNIRKGDVKKVDDITDCFLQAAAWVAWEENRRAIY
ncbi:ribonuclease H-like protein, partial [Trematosphaeria pertusa]